MGRAVCGIEAGQCSLRCAGVRSGQLQLRLGLNGQSLKGTNRLLGNKGSKWTATRNGASPERVCLRLTESKGDAYGNLQFLIYKDIFVRRAIMTDGEGREHFHFLESEEARVPIAALYGDEEGKGGSAWSPVSESAEARAAGAREPAPDLLSEEEEQPYPKHAAVVFFCFKQTTRPRSWCLRMIGFQMIERIGRIFFVVQTPPGYKSCAVFTAVPCQTP
ncbi:hypothetical protein SRHO_G00316820 [Serrasalmus rhombeus]